MKKLTIAILLAAFLLGSPVIAFADTVWDGTEQTDGTDQTDETQQPEDVVDGDEETTEPETPVEPEEPEAPKPDALTGLHSTCMSKTKVLLEWDASENAKAYQVYRKVADGVYDLLGTTEATDYTDKVVQWNTTYSYRIFPVNEDGVRGTTGKLTYQPKEIVRVTGKKYTCNRMKKDMTALAKLYSDYCTLTSIGTSVNGRQIYDLAVGDPNAEKSMLVVCTLHAREYICSAIAMEQIEYYLQHYNGRINGSKASDVFAKVQVHYIVMANPDGVMISQTKNSRWKANANGVDLNRNFPSTPFYVRGTKGAEGYSGKKALSEPESKAIATLTKKLIKNQNLLGVINYHAMGQIVFGNCTDKSLKKDTTTMYRLARKLTGYSSASSYSSATFGNYREYVMYQLGVPSITIEIGSTTAPCSFWEYASAYSKNKNVVFAITRALK